MEWLEGENLACRLVRRLLSLCETLLLLQPLAAALALAQQRNIVPRRRSSLPLRPAAAGRACGMSFCGASQRARPRRLSFWVAAI